MAEYRISIQTKKDEPFIPLEVRFTKAPAERIAIQESRKYGGTVVKLEWEMDQNTFTRYYRRGRRIYL